MVFNIYVPINRVQKYNAYDRTEEKYKDMIYFVGNLFFSSFADRLLSKYMYTPSLFLLLCDYQI